MFQADAGKRGHNPHGNSGAGHFVVICGVNTDTNMIYRDDPAWGYGKARKKLRYLNKVWTIKGSAYIDLDAAVALKPVQK